THIAISYCINVTHAAIVVLLDRVFRVARGCRLCLGGTPCTQKEEDNTGERTTRRNSHDKFGGAAPIPLESHCRRKSYLAAKQNTPVSLSTASRDTPRLGPSSPPSSPRKSHCKGVSSHNHPSNLSY